MPLLQSIMARPGAPEAGKKPDTRRDWLVRPEPDPAEAATPADSSRPARGRLNS